MVAEVLRLLKMAPAGARLASLLRRAAEGDPEALDYLRRQGWAEALDLLSPGAGSASRQAVDDARRAAESIRGSLAGDVVEGRCRIVDELPPEPWQPFVRWLLGRRWGTFVWLGPKGQGKTTGALRLAELWHRATGWPCLAVNIYPEDDHGFVQRVSTKRFMREVERIIAILDPENDEDDRQAGETPSPFQGESRGESRHLDDPLDRYRRRIVIVDEMSLAVSPHGMDPGRRMVRQIMAQARHLSWLVLYIGQLTRMLPTDLLNCEAVFVKKPLGREALVDRAEPLTQDLWARAGRAFGELRSSPWWERWPDERMWAYVDCPDIGRGKGYAGIVPINPPGTPEQDRPRCRQRAGLGEDQ